MEGDVNVRDVGIEFFPVLVGDALIVVKEEPEKLIGFSRPDAISIPGGVDGKRAFVGDSFKIPVGVFCFKG